MQAEERKAPDFTYRCSSKRLRSRIVCISDTLGLHRGLKLPQGDILIHAGNYTSNGSEAQANDFNMWLGELNFEHIIVVNGSNEQYATFNWKRGVEQNILTNATALLRDSCVVIRGIKIHGCSFSYKGTTNNYYPFIAPDTDIVVSHQPAKGYVDNGGKGCPAFLAAIKDLKPKLVVSGLVDSSKRIRKAFMFRTLFVNASLAPHNEQSSKMKDPVIIDKFTSSR